MEFSINPQMMFGLSFSVPAAVADKHLKLAGAAQITFDGRFLARR